MKKKFLIIALMLTGVLFAQEKKQNGWTKKGNFNLLFNQSAFSNWVAGGEDNIAVTAGVNYDFNYVKDDLTWDNKIIAAYGILNSKNNAFEKKTDDRLEFSSLLGKKAKGNWFYSGFFNFKTQFAKGYNYGKDANGKEIRTEYTNFLSPAYISFGPGMLWKKNENLKFNIAPATVRFTMVDKNRTLPNKAYFGVKQGESSLFELGMNASAYAKYNVMKNVSMENILNLYSNYLDQPQNIDIDYTLNLVMKVNDYLSANLAFQAIYDDNAYKGFQIREIFGAGFNYAF